VSTESGRIEPARPQPGTRLVFRWRKWDGGDHWEHDCLYLGNDEWGDWFGQPVGWRSARPGRDLVAEQPLVMLMPPAGDYAFTRNAPPNRTHTYIDLAWELHWQDAEPTGIDMDLDVVDHAVRGIYVDDRDEWAEHGVQYGYPPDVVAHLEALALDLERRVTAGEAPFDEATPQRWLERLAAVRRQTGIHPTIDRGATL
jgi:protein associated with RNAse G/E